MEHVTGIKALEKCVEILGSQVKVAAACGVAQQTVSERIKVGGKVPAEWCLPLERATNGDVTRHQLRPDLYPDESNDAPSDSETGVAAE